MKLLAYFFGQLIIHAYQPLALMCIWKRHEKKISAELSLNSLLLIYNVKYLLPHQFQKNIVYSSFKMKLFNDFFFEMTLITL